MPISRIVSGGQTGVDRAALNVAIFLEIEHGGWCPRGRRAEDGRIPEIYRLQEIDSRDYSVRTEQNVIDSDGTLILFWDQTTGGTELTRRLAGKHRRPLLCLDLHTCREEPLTGTAAEQVLKWLTQENICVLNIAGPRESTCSGIAQEAEQFLLACFT